MPKFTLFDTTLRDGAQTEGISFTVQDKIKKLLDFFEGTFNFFAI